MDRREPALTFPPVAGSAVLRVAGAVLVGGASRRFGSDKALALAGDDLLGRRVVSALRRAGVDPVVALGGTAGPALGLVTVADDDPGGGPLPAVAGVLRWFGRGHVLVCPCDLPLLRSGDVTALVGGLSLVVETDGPEVAGRTAVVARIAGRPEPSLAVWPTAWALPARRAVDAGSRSFRDGLTLGSWVGVDLAPRALVDADTPQALHEALASDKVD